MNLSIIPKPLKEAVFCTDKYYVLNEKSTVKVNENINAFNDLNKFIDKAFGYSINADDKGKIAFKLDKKIEDSLGKEGYKLEIKEEGIIISAPYEAGVFYGVQTLKQLIVQFMNNEESNIPLLAIEDKPIYRHRGYMLDVCRHFFPVEVVLKMIDTIALSKVNILHLHLTEDQGWRIQIDKYPKLTSIGARRGDTIGDGRWHGGYFSRQDIKTIVDYAATKYITVIPEINMPGHSMAALASYNWLGCFNNPIKVSNTFGIKPDIYCAGKEGTYKFIFDVLDEVMEMFPSEYIHLGGDEAPKVRWAECPDCMKAVKDNNLKSVEQLQGLFMNKVIQYLKSKGRKAICWNEAIYSKVLDESAVCHYWSDGKKPDRVIREMNKGRSGIISKFTPYYLDYPHAMHSLKAAYSFTPELDGLNDNADILGLEAPLWTEYVTNLPRIEYMTYPRLGAISEIAWTDRNLRNYNDFYSRLPYYYRLLDIYSVQYAGYEEINPNLFKKFKQMKEFAKMMFTRENMKGMRASSKAVKAMVEVRKELEKENE